MQTPPVGRGTEMTVQGNRIKENYNCTRDRFYFIHYWVWSDLRNNMDDGMVVLRIIVYQAKPYLSQCRMFGGPFAPPPTFCTAR